MRKISTLARSLTLLALGAVWAGASGGCIIVNGGDDDSWSGSSSTIKEVRRFEIAHQPATALHVRTENGSVDVDRAPQSGTVVVSATVRARNEERLAATKVVAERDATGVVRVSVVWPDDRRRNNEGCSFEITTPDAHGVDIESSNGSIRIAGLSGDAKLATSNGRLTVSAHDGPANLRTSNGTIDVERVTGDVVAKTSNGGVDVRQVRAAVDAVTSNGAVDVSLSDESAGPVRIASSNGSVDLECGRAFEGEVVMSTSNAGVRFRDASGRVLRGKGHLEATVGEARTRSSISTSNGSIDVRVAGVTSAGG